MISRVAARVRALAIPMALLALFVAPRVSQAQAVKGTLLGTVSDAQGGAVLPRVIGAQGAREPGPR